MPTSAEIETIATLRGLSPEGVALAAERGLLFCADSQEGRAWVITDSRRKNAQARRLDGKHGSALTPRHGRLPGSVGAWPVGLYEARDFPTYRLVEGGPDLLAAFHLAWCATSTPETLALGKGIDVVGKLGVVAMLGRHPILESELRHFKGKRVRIFADADEPGLQAEGRWWHQLESAGAKVDGYSFAGFLRSDGKPVKDLNDFALIDPDQWEARRDAIEEAFAFSDRKEAMKEGSHIKTKPDRPYAERYSRCTRRQRFRPDGQCPTSAPGRKEWMTAENHTTGRSHNPSKTISPKYCHCARK